MLQQLSNFIDNINNIIGKAVSWLALSMVLLMCFNVVSRYILNINLVWQHELVRFMHAMIFLISVGYTLLVDKHVRVDIIYHNLSDKGRAIVDLSGTILFLLPFCFAVGYFSYDFIANSWAIKESSSEYNGMVGVFLLKSCIWLFAISLALQGVSVVCKSLITLRGGK